MSENDSDRSDQSAEGINKKVTQEIADEDSKKLEENAQPIEQNDDLADEESNHTKPFVEDISDAKESVKDEDGDNINADDVVNEKFQEMVDVDGVVVDATADTAIGEPIGDKPAE